MSSQNKQKTQKPVYGRLFNYSLISTLLSLLSLIPLIAAFGSSTDHQTIISIVVAIFLVSVLLTLLFAIADRKNRRS